MKLRGALINLCLVTISALCAVSVVAVYQYGANLRRQPLRKAPRTQQELDAYSLAAIRVGEVSAVTQKTGKPELVLFLRTGCPHCTNNLPLYRDLMSSDVVKSQRVVVTAVFSQPDTQEVAQKYIADNKLGIQHVVAAQNISRFGVQGTPTVLAVHNGKIVASWFGERSDGEKVLKAVNKLG